MVGRSSRRFVDAILTGAGLASIALAVLALAGPWLGICFILLDGDSMAPTMPLGSLLVVATSSPAAIGSGDVITYRTGNGTLVTHRVVAPATVAGQPAFAVKGDANPTPDAGLILAAQVVGQIGRAHV